MTTSMPLHGPAAARAGGGADRDASVTPAGSTRATAGSTRATPGGTRVDPVGALLDAWRPALAATLALLVGGVGLASTGTGRVAAIAGAVLVLASLVVAGQHPRLAAAGLVAGLLPVVVLTWWSVVTPVLGLLCLGFGWPRGWRPRRRPRAAGAGPAAGAGDRVGTPDGVSAG